MSVRPAIVTSKQRHRTGNERLYASHSDGVNGSVVATALTPREVYLYRGLDKDLLAQNPDGRKFTSTRSKSNVTNELLHRYKQSIAPNHPAYHSAQTLDEAVNPPWSLHYTVKRQPATPNLISNTSVKLPRQESARRGQSAPLVRSPSPPDMLHIPEPRLVTLVTTEPSSAKNRSSSATGLYESTDKIDRAQRYLEAPAALLADPLDGSAQQFSSPSNTEHMEQPVQIIFTKADPSSMPPPPIFVYKKLATWALSEVSLSPLQKSMDASATPLNPHYVHRPGVIAVDNVEKKTLERENTLARRMNKHRRARDRRNEPITAVTPMPLSARLTVESEGVKLVYDPRLTLEDRSQNLQKYFIDGRLYLIKEHRYNVLNNVDPATIQKLNQRLTVSPRPKYYQTVSIDKYQLPKPPAEVHYNAPETFFYNTIPKRRHRYIINPNFISENLNVNRVSLSERPPTTTIYA